MFGELLLSGLDEALGIVLGLRSRPPLLVLVGELFGFLDHLLNVGVIEAARRLDAVLLLLARALVLGADVDDAVGVYLERDLDLRHAEGRRRDPNEVELT